MKLRHRLRLLISTARYVTPAQIYHRMARMARVKWWKLRSQTAPQGVVPTLAAPNSLCRGLDEIAQPGPWSVDVADSVERAKDIAHGRFRFLNQGVDCEKQPPWHDTTLSQLWRYHLHYFDYVHDLLIWSRRGGAKEAFEVFRRLVVSWIESNNTISGDGWHPYTVSLRVVNWLHAAFGFANQLESNPQFREEFLKSLSGQVSFLSQNLELDVRGNHLLKNLRALLFAGACFGQSETLAFDRLLQRLKNELAEQVLPDGGHFERSPGYHLAVLQDCLDLGLGLSGSLKTSVAWLDDAIRRMMDYLVAVLPPDGRVPLLKDTSWDASPPPLALLNAGALYLGNCAYKRDDFFGLYHLLRFGVSGWERFRRWPINNEAIGSRQLPSTAHYVMRDDVQRDYLIFDAGKPCPDYLPAHAHADLLTYELLVLGHKIVVDSGVYEYSRGKWRDYFRSTRAHNTVEVCERNQSEVWDSFRVARRAKPGRVLWQQADDLMVVQGEHDGYLRLTVPVVHRRTIAWKKDGFWLVVDQLLGKGEVRATSYVHLHPELDVHAEGSSTWRVDSESTALWLRRFDLNTASNTSERDASVTQGWYSEKFGQISANPVLAFRQNGRLPICFGYVWAKRTAPDVKLTGVGDDCRVVVRHEECRHSLDLRRLGDVSFT